MAHQNNETAVKVISRTPNED